MDLNNLSQVSSENVNDSNELDKSLLVTADKKVNFDYQENLYKTFGVDLDQSDQLSEEFTNSINELAPKINNSTLGLTKNEITRKGDVNQNKLNAFTNYLNTPGYNQKTSNQAYIPDVQFRSQKLSGYDRIENHHNFKDLGWSPLRDNEEYYNSNTSAFWDFTRAVPHFINSAASGFMSGYRSIGDWFDGDNYWLSADDETAYEFEEATRLGSSTRGGLSGFGTNLFLQFGYTAGILSSIAAESMVLAAAEAATFGGATPLVAARAGANSLRLGKGLRNMYNAFKPSSLKSGAQSILNNIRNIDSAKSFWTATRSIGATAIKSPVNVASKIFTPQTVQMIKAFKTSDKAFKDLSNLAKTAKTFGAFYKDLRAINFAMSESKLEAGFSYNQVYSDGYAEQLKLNKGEALTQEQIANVNDKALEAASTTIMLNAPILFATNQLVLSTALRGFSPTMRRVFTEKSAGFAKNIIKSKPVVDKVTGKLNKGLYTDVSPANWRGQFINIKKLKALGAKGVLTNTSHGLLRYAAASLGEGVQEVYQEGVQVGVADYYKTLMSSAGAPPIDLLQQSIYKGAVSQMTGQGFETFLSGFLMGGLAQGPQKLFFEMIPQMYQQKRNPEKFAEYEKNKAEFIKWANEIGDDIQDNPFDYFNESKLAFFAAKEGSEETKKHLFSDDIFGFRDAKDDTMFNYYHFLMTSESEGLFIEQLEDLLKLDDAQLKELYKDPEKSETNVREKIQKSIDDIKSYKKEYKKSFDVIVNDVDYEQYEKDDVRYNNARAKYNAIEHARMIYLFANNSFKQALKRRDSMESYLKTVFPAMDKLTPDDFTILLSTDSIDKEISILELEVSNLEKIEKINAQDKNLLDAKKAKIEALLKYRLSLEFTYDKESEVYDREKTELLRKPLLSYIKSLQGNENLYYDDSEINKVLQMLVDHNNLDKRAQVLDRTISLFSNQDKITDVIDRMTKEFKTLYKESGEIFKKNIKKQTSSAEAQEYLNQLEALNVYPASEEELIAFLNTGDASLITEYRSALGIVNAEIGGELFNKIEDLKEVYNLSSGKAKETKETEETKETKAEKPSSIKNDIDEQVDEIIPDDIKEALEDVPQTNIVLDDQSPFAQEVLLTIYGKNKMAEYESTGNYPTLPEWLSSTEGAKKINGIEKIKKIWYTSLDKENLSEEELKNIYDNDLGFQEWVNSQKNNEVINLILAIADLSINDFKTGLESNEEYQDQQDKKLDFVISKPKSNLNILKREAPTSEEGEKIVLYTLTDLEGNQLSANELKRFGIDKADYLKIDDARAAYNTILKQQSALQESLSYDGIDLKYLDEIENSEGQRYTVLGGVPSANGKILLKVTPVTEENKTKEERENDSVILEEKDFNKLYTKVEQSFKGITFTENMSKLDPAQVSQVYPKFFSEDYNKENNKEIVNQRFARTLEMLTPEQLSSATIIITRNNRRTSKKLKLNDNPENSFVNDNGDKYSISILLDPAATTIVKNAFKDTVYEYPKSFRGDIGFIKNDFYSFNGVKKGRIDISTIENSKIERYITPEYSTAIDLKNAVIKDRKFVSAIDKLMGDSNSLNFSYADFSKATEFTIEISNGKFQQGKEKISLKDLDYNTFNGNIVIMVNTKQQDGVLGKSYITNAEGAEELALIKNVESQLKEDLTSGTESNKFNEARTLGRYVAIIKSPSGAITLAQLSQDFIGEDALTNLYTDLLEQANKVKEGKVEKKDVYSWNALFNSKFYTALNPNIKSSFLDLNVDLQGNIVLSLSAEGISVEEKILAADLAEYANDVNKISELFEKLNNNKKVIEFNKGPYKLNFSEKNLLEVFPLDANIDEVLDKTKTDLDKRVRFNHKIYVDTTQELSSPETLTSISVDNPKADDYSNTEVKEEDVVTNEDTQSKLAKLELAPQTSEVLNIEDSVAIINEYSNSEIAKIVRNSNNEAEDFLGRLISKTTEEVEGGRAEQEVYENGTIQRIFTNDGSSVQRLIDNSGKVRGIPLINLTMDAKEAGLLFDGKKDFSLTEKQITEFFNSKFTKPAQQTSEVTLDLNFELTLDEKIKQAEKVLEKEKALIEAEWNRTKQNRRKLKKESASYQEAFKKLKDLMQERNDLNAFKILDENESDFEIQNLDEFINWAQENLPDFITIENLDSIKSRLKANGVTVGQFSMRLKELADGVKVKGVIYTGEKSPFKYHEAFHAVFRLLLTTEEQNKLYKIAKDEVRTKFKTTKTFNEELNKLKARHPKYKNMSASELEKEYLEEYMADEFDKFKTNPRSTKTNSTIKSFFNRLLEWIKSAFKYKQNNLTGFFTEVNAGKFKNRAVQDNVFTASLNNDVTIEAYKIIPYEVVAGEKMTSSKYLDPSTSDVLIRMIGYTFAERKQNSTEADDILLGTIIDEYADLYNPEQERYNNKSEKDFEKLENIYDALTLMDGEAVIEGVNQYLDLINVKYENIQDELDELEDTVGSRKVTDYNKDASQFGGYASASKTVKMFIASVAIDSQDMFGNTELLNGTKIKVPVNHIDVYNGLMLAGVHKTSTKEILEGMYIFSRRNENTRAVIDAFFEKTGIKIDNENQSIELPKQIKNSQLFNQFVKTFKNARFDYLFILENATNIKDVAIISAANRDSANSQIDIWKKNYNNLFESFSTNKNNLNNAILVATELNQFLNNKNITNKLLTAEAKRLSKNLSDALGISLSPLYLEVSAASSLDAPSTKYQKMLIDLGKNKRLLTSEDASMFLYKTSAEKIEQKGKSKKTIPTPENLFIDDENAGMSSKLKAIALGNAFFDETVGNTVFLNPNKDLVYAHQKQTYHSRKINSLNSIAEFEKLKKKYPSNILLNNPAFKQMSIDKQHELLRLAGKNAATKKDSTSSEGFEYSTSQGKTYGDFTSVEFIKHLINLYTTKYNTVSNKNDVVNVTNKEGSFDTAITPVLIRIMESADTTDFALLPVIKTVVNGQITDETVNAFVQIVEKEYNKIKENFEKGLGDIVNYNESYEGNGFKFFKADTLISQELQDTLIKNAEEDLKWENVSKNVFSNVKSNLESISNDYLQYVNDNKLIFSNLIEGAFPEGATADKAMAELNLLRDNLDHNLKQIFYSNWLNTLAINEITLGEEAKLFKDSVVDPIKRGKQQNGAHDSVDFDVLPEDSENKLRIKHTMGDGSIALIAVTDDVFEQKFTNGARPGNKDGESTDAQSYTITKGARYFNYAIGELSISFAEMLNKIEDNKEITSDDFFGKDGYLKSNATLNSEKYVYGDGQTFVKTSTTFLTPAETSNFVNGKWVPKIGMEKLHYLRENMETFAKNNPGIVPIVAPVSAIKMFKQNVIDIIDLTSENKNVTIDDVTLLNAKDFGRQMVNPSNKMEITKVNQMKTLITSEQYLGNDFKVVIAGEELSMKDVISEYHKMTAAGVRFDFNQKVYSIFDVLRGKDPKIVKELLKSNDLDIDLSLFIETAQSNAKASSAGSNMIEFFSLNENGQPKYELNNTLTASKFEQFFLAYFSKKVLAQKTAGHSFTLRSSFGASVIRKVYSLDENNNLDKQKVIRRNVWERKKNQEITIDLRKEDGFEKLTEALKNNPDGVVVIDRLRVGLPEYVKTGSPENWVFTNKRYGETITAPHHKEVMDWAENYGGEIPDAIADMFIVRVPSQDKHSAMNVKIVDFSPVYLGSTAMFADELVEISGADFDVDKVYASIKEWRYTNGKFIEYGSRKEKEGFDDYVNYINKKIKVEGGYLNNALKQFKSRGVEDEITATDIIELEKLGYSDDAINALRVLKLPITYAEFNDYIKKEGVAPYTAPMSNKTLDYQLALVGNTKLTESKTDAPISYQPADVAALKEEWKKLSDEFPFIKELNSEVGIAIDSLLGQAFTHKNVKENSKLIGSVVPMNVIINFLKENKIKLRDEFGDFRIDGKSYKEFYDHEDNNNALYRTQYLLSNLITAATDDAKERLLSKLGYIKPAIKNVETMVAFGIPLHTATKIINVEPIKEIIKEEMYGSELRARIKELRLNGVKMKPVTTKSIDAGVNNELTEGEELGLLVLFNKINTVTGFSSKMISIFNLNLGFGKDFSSLMDREDDINSLGVYKSDEEFKKQLINRLPLPFDVRKALTSSGHYINEYLKINKEFTNLILPKIFITQTDQFKKIFTAALSYVDTINNPNAKYETHQNVLAYLTIKAYMNQLFKTEAGAVVGGSLSNAFLYPQSGSSFTINKVIDDLREKYKNKDNYFLKYYLFNQKASAKNNKTGMNIITTNSFGKNSNNEKVRIQNGFQTLYGERETRIDAMHILHYAMIKDGLQFDYGSILDAITPFGMENYLNASKNAFDAFKGIKSFEDVFGLSSADLFKEFVNNYGKSTPVSYKLKKLYIDKKSYKPTRTNTGIKWTMAALDEPSSFPRFYKFQDPDLGTTTLYELKEATLNGEDVLTNSLLSRIRATEVVYDSFKSLGSFSQNPIAFIFDNDNFSRPTLIDLQEKNNFFSESFEALTEDDFGNFEPLEDNFDNFEIDYEYSEETKNKLDYLSNQNIKANENSIMINDENIADLIESEETSNKLDAFIPQQTSEVLNRDIIFDSAIGEQVAWDASSQSWIKKIDESMAVSEEKTFKKDGFTYSYMDYMPANQQYQRYNSATGEVISENITKEEYEEARGNLDDDPFRVEQISFEEAKRLYEYSKTAQQTTEVKEGVSELFESNPELANSVYETLGFKVSDSSIALNKINNTKIGDPITLFINNMPVEYKRVSKNYFESKQITKEQETDFINSVESTTISIEEFIEREGTNVRYSLDEIINFYLDKLPKNQITPQQKQQAQQLYSQYLDSIFPNSKVKDIVYHNTDSIFEKFQSIPVAKFFTKSPIGGKKYRLPILLNISNPKVFSEFTEDDEMTYGLAEVYAENKEKDAIINGIERKTRTEYIVFEPEQIHILGSKQDIEGFKEFVSKPTPQTSEVEKIKIPDYKVNKLLKNQDGSIRYASTDGNVITINPVEGEDGKAKFFDYFTGKEGGVTSKQKVQVLNALISQGWSMDRITNVLNTNKQINTFLVLHEQNHIDNNDKDVYWKNGKDLLTQDKIDIEVRATIIPLLKMENAKQSMQPTTEVETIENVQLVLDFNELDNAETTTSLESRQNNPLINELKGSDETLIEDFYNEFLFKNNERKEALRKANIGTTVKSLVKSFEKSKFTAEEFIDNIKKCYLNIK